MHVFNLFCSISQVLVDGVGTSTLDMVVHDAQAKGDASTLKRSESERGSNAMRAAEVTGAAKEEALLRAQVVALTAKLKVQTTGAVKETKASKDAAKVIKVAKDAKDAKDAKSIQDAVKQGIKEGMQQRDAEGDTLLGKRKREEGDDEVTELASQLATERRRSHQISMGLLTVASNSVAGSRNSLSNTYVSGRSADEILHDLGGGLSVRVLTSVHVTAEQVATALKRLGLGDYVIVKEAIAAAQNK
jgi:hypothetical protein